MIDMLVTPNLGASPQPGPIEYGLYGADPSSAARRDDDAGPVSLEGGYLVGPRRYWPNLWKPTIYALDQILGRTRPDRPWHPLDGRIVTLGLHCSVDASLGNTVRIVIEAAPSPA